jgi:bifunctional non-homologous end joining protein LigD
MFVDPMLAVTGPLPTDEDRWAFEPKWDGFRAIVQSDGRRLRVMSRRGTDLAGRLPELAPLAGVLPAGTTLDGELVVVDADGRVDFDGMRRRGFGQTSAGRLLFVAFDVLTVGADVVVARRWEARRALLVDLALEGPAWCITPSYPGEGATLFEVTRAPGIEGVVAKRLDSTYEPGVRTRHWLKVKNHLSQDFVVGGYLPGEGSRGRLGALLLGVYESDGNLCFAGRVGTGFTDTELTRLLGLLDPLRRNTPPFDPPPPRQTAKEAVWVEPEIVVDVEFTEWTNVGILRHPSYKGQRTDLDPREVIREVGA